VRLSSTVRSPDWITAEYNNQNSPSTFYSISTASSSGSSAATLHWLVSDQLGTPRMVFDQSGLLANVSRHDYLPFGEELVAGTGGRTPQQGYSANDYVRQKFTQKERDSETGLDYFGARYYTTVQGRFTSADPDSAGAELSEPQSWNGYAYVGNTPLTSTDPFGLWKEVDCTSGKGKCWESDDKHDTITSLAKILNVSAKDLNKFFQNPTIHIGDAFDASGFGRENIPTSRDQGPAVVQVFLVSEPESTGDKIKRFFSNDESRFRAARMDKFWQDLMVPKCAQEHKCMIGIFYPGGFGARITFSGAGQLVGHGARHLVELGVSQEAVESAIVEDIQAVQSTTQTTGKLKSGSGLRFCDFQNHCPIKRHES